MRHDLILLRPDAERGRADADEYRVFLPDAALRAESTARASNSWEKTGLRYSTVRVRVPTRRTDSSSVLAYLTLTSAVSLLAFSRRALPGTRLQRYSVQYQQGASMIDDAQN